MADISAEIFATGEWGGRSWSESDLDAMAANFKRLGAHVKPPLKLGHDAKQILAQREGQPALGWVRDLKRVGAKLIADFADVPNVIRDLMATKRYRRVSSEIYPAWQATTWEKNVQSGATGPVLSAVALLGADVPEVKTLEDLGRVLATEGIAPVTFAESGCADEAQAIEGCGDVVVPLASSALFAQTVADAVVTALAARGDSPAPLHPRTTEVGADGHHKEHPMTAEEKAALFTEMQAKFAEQRAADTAAHAAEVAALKGEVTQLSEAKTATEARVTKLAEEAEAAKQQAAELAAQALKAEAIKFAEDALRKPRIFKGQVPLATALYRQLPTTVSLAAAPAKAMGLAEKDWSLRDLFVAFTESYPTANILREMAEDRGPTPATDASAKLKKIALEHKLDLSESADRQQALALAEADGDGLVIPDYTTPTGVRH